MSWLTKRRGKVGDESSRNSTDKVPSINWSTESLSASQLDMALMEMLNIRQGEKMWDSFCKGNPITSAGKRRQLCRIISVVAVPLMILIGMTANTFGVTLRGYLNASGIRKVLRFSTELGVLIHNLQKERDSSALYLSSDRAEAKEALLSSYIDTDNILEELSYWPSIQDKDAPEYHSQEKYQIHLNRHRYQLDSLNQSVTSELLFYTKGIDVILDWLYASITEARSGTVWRSLVAFLEITDSKKSFGIERALGAIYYTKGKFQTIEDYLWFSESQDIANASFWSARRFSDVAASIYDDLVAQNDTIVGVLEDMRRDIRVNEQFNRDGSLEKAEYWMMTVTSYLQVLLDTQDAVVSSIFVELDERDQEDLFKMIAIAVVFSGVLLMCPVIIHGVYSLTTEMQSYSITLADRTKALKTEKKRTDLLLYQMLPKSVAEMLKRNEEVNAETFSQVTIFFSDIVDFTTLSAQCSPVQVVNMLNSLYTLFDDRIEQYDVYKVETIGDAYMVASGLPQKNGKRHAAEISMMALDLVNNLVELDIPHLPGTRFRLRIGIHTGPVIAGVVGFKMPRYCLFGDTVTIASKMESLGTPNYIHLSQPAHDTLQQLGGFVMKPREDDTVAKDMSLSVALKGNLRTYWLLGVEGAVEATTGPTPEEVQENTPHANNQGERFGHHGIATPIIAIEPPVCYRMSSRQKLLPA